MWFRWEHSAIGWTPVVYHIERPRDRNGATVAQPVPLDCIGGDGEPRFWRLVERFPAPKEGNYIRE